MNLKINGTLQSILVAAQGANLTALNGKIQTVATLLIGIVQALIAIRAQFVNPDGTQAAVAYRPKGQTDEIS